MLFSKRKRELPALISDEEIEFSTGLNYNNVLEWLVGLSGDDYAKVCQVAAIYRQSDFEACKVLDVEYQPTTFIHPPEPAEHKEPSLIDDLLMDDEPSEKPKKTTKKIKVNH